MLRFSAKRHYPNIGEMTVSLGDTHSNNALSVIVREGFSDAECTAELRRGKSLLVAELRKLADTMECELAAHHSIPDAT